jgi:hypothetical protein
LALPAAGNLGFLTEIIMKKGILICGCMAVLAGGFLTGCASTGPSNSSTVASPLQPKSGTLPDLQRFDIATVVPFDTAKANNADATVGESFAEDIARRLKEDFGSLFTQVNVGKPTGATNELIITGEITKYTPGSRAMRGLLIGLGAASFRGEACLKDGDTSLAQMPFSKLWAWGGEAGKSKGIEEMVAEAAASVANTVARQKGWTRNSGK